MIKYLALSILLTFNLFAIELNEEQYKNAKFIYNKTHNKDYASFLISVAFHESSLNNNITHVCDLKIKNKCYDSIGMFQVNLHTALLFVKGNEMLLQKKLEDKLFNLKIAKLLFKDNDTNMIPKAYQNNINYISKQYIIKHLQIYNGGAKNKDISYANKIYKTYLEIKDIKFD
jgi:hypothetical protein